MAQEGRFPIEEAAFTHDKEFSAKSRKARAKRRRSIFVDQLVNDELVFSPIPPGARHDRKNEPTLRNEIEILSVDITKETERDVWRALADGAIPEAVIDDILREVRFEKEPRISVIDPIFDRSEDVLVHETALERLGLAAIRVARAVHDAFLHVAAPFKEFHLQLTDRAKLALALGWEAIARLGRYPLPPYGMHRLRKIDAKPAGTFHFVSASDRDAGFYYTMGCALSPEAQAAESTNVSFGLDGELIVPGQAVSPIPPLLSLATRLFSSGMMTSSNISEEQHSIPIRSFPQPDNYTDLKPIRPGLNTYVPCTPGDVDAAVDAVATQLERNDDRFEVSAVIDVTALTPAAAESFATRVLKAKKVRKALGRKDPNRIGLFYNIGYTNEKDRTQYVREAVDLAKTLGLKYVAVTDDVEDAWLPGIHEYFPYWQMNDIMRYADRKEIIVIDGRPVDPMYTSSTALQRIQSVMTTLSVDILKMGMWLTLDAVSSEKVWRQVVSNPAIARTMCLMPIGIVEPWSAFVDNRSTDKNARAVILPFSKIKFMINEAKRLGMPSLLTDTRHKSHWVLLGEKGGDFPKHPREGNGTTSLLTWKEFMQCERLARKADILLGQAGSIEVSQIFRIISETTFDAAKAALNPATAFWTAETERVLRSPYAKTDAKTLQQERAANVDPYLAVVNRIYESHAKMDGWLRFLSSRYRPKSADRRRVGALARKLMKLKTRAEAAQDVLLKSLSETAGSRVTKELQKAWDDCCDAFNDYHAAVRGKFLATRDEVDRHWNAMRRKAARSRRARK